MVKVGACLLIKKEIYCIYCLEIQLFSQLFCCFYDCCQVINNECVLHTMDEEFVKW